MEIKLKDKLNLIYDCNIDDGLSCYYKDILFQIFYYKIDGLNIFYLHSIWFNEDLCKNKNITLILNKTVKYEEQIYNVKLDHRIFSCYNSNIDTFCKEIIYNNKKLINIGHYEWKYYNI